MYPLLRKIMFCLPAEVSHTVGLKSIDAMAALGLGRLLTGKMESNPVRVMGLDFKNPVGLAAGFDKNADHIRGFDALGFGFVEVNGVHEKIVDSERVCPIQ